MIQQKARIDRHGDFIFRDARWITVAFQVCYEVGPENRERETEGLLGAMDEFDLAEGTILTFDQEDELRMKGKRIILLPVWKWLLAGDPP